MKVAVFGASGYTGRVLMRLLLDHPEVTDLLPVSSTKPGRALNEQDTGIGPDIEGKLWGGGRFLNRDQALKEQPDAVFSALPHGASMEFCKPFFGISVVIDLSADFRLRDVQAHQRAYAQTAPEPELRKKAVYGLAEIYQEDIKGADIIAVPGCYPTCILLPLLPLSRLGLLNSVITVNSLSGISGAGRIARETSLYVERSENSIAYQPGRKHRHYPEIIQELAIMDCNAPLFFTPHMVPMRRGMFSTISMPLKSEEGVWDTRIGDVFSKAYNEEPFIELTAGSIPATRDVIGSNRCDIGWYVEEAVNGPSMLYLFSVIDNLMKGSSGQAVQDFNIRFGFPQTAGLSLRGET